ncbi:MAG TPA: glycosyltransferase [Pyrinomonadaceae bacterium]|nr:glycosyltransferase [Pyrinomonadaceae bacterium]
MRNGWTRRAWTWHEAADVRVFHPLPEIERPLDLVWIGNWGDDERTAELQEFLIEPVKDLQLNAEVYGVRYPQEAIAALTEAGIRYRGWLPNYKVPEVFARARVTLHIPRRPYVTDLPGIPTIRPFEALACGVPLICSPWHDTEHLFTPGRDFLIAHNGDESKQLLARVLNEPSVARELATNGLATIRQRHTCAHRVDELLAIYEQLMSETRELAAAI